MTPQTFASELAAIRHAGSVYGLILTRGHELLFHDTPFPDERVRELAASLDDIAYYFKQEKRTPDQLAFGYDGGHLLILLFDDFRMVVFHHQGDEVDFVARASRAFLKDHAMDLLTQEWARTLPSNGAL
jgi:hypothetical protein